MNVINHIDWIDLPRYDGDRTYKGRPACYRSNLQQIDATAAVLTALMEHTHSSVSVMSMLRTHHEEMLSQFSASTFPEPELLTNVSFCYAGGTCSSADTLIVVPVMATGTRYEKLIDEIRNKSQDLFGVLEQQEFARVIVVGEKRAWLSIGGFLSRRLSEIPATDYPVRESFFDHDIQRAVAALFCNER